MVYPPNSQESMISVHWTHLHRSLKLNTQVPRDWETWHFVGPKGKDPNMFATTLRLVALLYIWIYDMFIQYIYRYMFFQESLDAPLEAWFLVHSKNTSQSVVAICFRQQPSYQKLTDTGKMQLASAAGACENWLSVRQFAMARNHQAGRAKGGYRSYEFVWNIHKHTIS